MWGIPFEAKGPKLNPRKSLPRNEAGLGGPQLIEEENTAPICILKASLYAHLYVQLREPQEVEGV